MTPATVVVAVLLVGTGLAAGLMLGGESGNGEMHDTAGLTGTAVLASIGVLPFEDLPPEGDQRWFVDGIAEEILKALSRIPEPTPPNGPLH